nr:peptidylprolyl isomerase [Aneurinibacillus tyrosinisolvens]
MAGCGKKDAVVAKYDGGQITESQYRDYIELVKTVEPGIEKQIDAGDKEALQQVLHFQVMTDYLSSKVKEDAQMKKEADDSFKQFEAYTKQQLGQGKKIEQFYADKKVTTEELKTFFLNQIKMISYFSKDVPEAEKKKKYEEAKNLGFLTKADVRHILVSTEKRSKAEAKKKAEALLQQLRAGADFAKLAKENTDDPGSKETGGLYHYDDQQSLAQTDEAYKKAAMTLPINKISDLVESQFGYHIMRVESRTEQPYDQIKGDLARAMAQEKEQQFYTEKLKGIIKEENIPASMIKQQPVQQGPGPSGQPGGQPVQQVPGQQPPVQAPSNQK